MKIACCTMEMITLIFLLFVSMNGGYSYLDNDVAVRAEPVAAKADLVSKPTSELVTAWGEPDNVATASDLGFVSQKLAEVEIWSYYHPVRSVSVRDDIVVSIREG